MELNEENRHPLACPYCGHKASRWKFLFTTPARAKLSPCPSCRRLLAYRATVLQIPAFLLPNLLAYYFVLADIRPSGLNPIWIFVAGLLLTSAVTVLTARIRIPDLEISSGPET